MARPRVLVISADRVGAGMAGTGIRATELARALTPVADVALAGVDSWDAGDLGVPVVGYALRRPTELHGPIAAADAIVAQPQWPHLSRRLVRSGARLIFDLYTPEPLEVLERRPPLRPLVTALTEDRIGDALRTGHHFLCASDKQRDLWVGTMLGERLLRPRVYDRDSSLDERLAVVPFGVEDAPPTRAGSPIRERFPAIGADDEVVLWNGGIWNWFDAPTAIRAVAELQARRPSAKLVFMGAASIGPAARATEAARAVAAELGLIDRVVFFNDAWVPYEERGSWLLEADCALSTHVEHLETRFAFRTRLLDCFWAGLPIVCTEGDDLAARVVADDLGAAVAPSDPAAVSAALEAVLDRGRPSYADALARAASDHAWSRVAEPVRRYVTAPERPPRLGRGVPPRPGELVRRAGFNTAMWSLNTFKLGWPKL